MLGMKVLITGGYGFIGSSLVEKFYKEGHDVTIIDNLITGNRRNVSVKHKSYITNVESKECEEVFNSEKFEVVIHLAAQVDVKTSMDNPVLDSKSNIVGLTNMLHLSAKYGVKKFVFASSAAVYGNHDTVCLTEEMDKKPVNIYGVNKLFGEHYCEKWSKLYHLDTLIFRFSNVYGPRQGASGEGGVISTFINRMINQEELVVYGDGSQTRDFIYVKDVTEAIFRAVLSDLSGTFNLSTNDQTSVNQLIDEIKKYGTVQKIAYKNSREGDIHHSSLDNEKLLKELDWVPHNSFEKGIELTFQSFYQNKSRKKKDIEEPHNSKEKWTNKKYTKSLLHVLENLFLFLIVIVLTVTVPENYVYIDMKLLYILLVGLFLGKTQAFLASAFTMGFFVYQKLNNGSDIVSLLVDNEILAYFATYIFIGLIVGYVIDRKNIEVETSREDLRSLEDRYQFLDTIYQETRVVKEELQNQIVHSEDSIGKVYNIVKKLDSLEPEDIFTGAVSVIEQTMGSKDVSIYMIGQNDYFLRLISRSKQTKVQIPSSIRLEENETYQQVVKEKKVYINRELKPDVPYIIVPVINGDHVIAVVCIYRLDFDQLTLYFENLLHVVMSLITNSITRAYEYVTATQDERYLKGTKLLNSQYFHRLLDSKKQAKLQLDIPFTLLEVMLPIEHMDEINNLANTLRNTDLIGVDKDSKVWIILSNTRYEEAHIVEERIRNQQFPVRKIKEDELYV